jgi:adenosine deaminase
VFHADTPRVPGQLRGDDHWRDFPKVELHRHLDGSVRLGTIWQLARNNRLDLGAASLAELERIALLREPVGSLQEMLAALSPARRVLCTYEAVERVTFENVEDAWRDGVRLLELRFSPGAIAASGGLDLPEIIEAVLAGAERAAARYPLELGLIGTLRRSADPQINERVVATLLRAAAGHSPGAWRLVGFDLADDERAAAPEAFAPLMDKAREAGFGITVHTGLNTDARWMRRTLLALRPDRIGHGLRVLEDERLAAEVRERGILIEVSPTSNWITASVPSLEAHPLPHLVAAGLAVSINSDDPQLYGIDLVHEYALCARLFGFGPEEFRRMNRQAAEHSFLPAECRGRVIEPYLP